MVEAKKKQEEKAESASGRLRSPGYPAINLESAIERAQKFFNLEHRNAANRAVAMKHWGYETGSSLGARVVAALKQFGLMKETGDRAQLTDLALRILLDKRPDSKEKLTAIQEAALTPKIHAALKAHWPHSLPTDDNLRHDLIFDWKFNENFVDKFIRQFRETLAFAKLDSSDSISAESADTAGRVDIETPEDDSAESEKGGRIGAPKILPPKPGMNQDIYTLPGSGAALVLQWPNELTIDDIEDVELWLDMMKRKLKRTLLKKDQDEAE